MSSMHRLRNSCGRQAFLRFRIRRQSMADANLVARACCQEGTAHKFAICRRTHTLQACALDRLRLVARPTPIPCSRRRGNKLAAWKFCLAAIAAHGLSVKVPGFADPARAEWRKRKI